jgi:hypothetical protein
MKKEKLTLNLVIANLIGENWTDNQKEKIQFSSVPKVKKEIWL